MPVRPYVTSGIALASAGILVAAVPTIAPPLTPRDVQVAADVQTQLTAAQSDLLKSAQSVTVDPENFVQALQSIANLAGVPGPTTGAPVTTQNLADLPEIIQGIVNDFFEGGVVQVVGNLALALVEGNQLAEDLVTAFFFGGVPNENTPAGFVGVINVLIDAVLGGLGTLTAAAPLDAEDATTFTAAAAAPVATQQLADLPGTIQDIVNDFFEGGVVQVVGNLALALVEGNQLASDLVTAFFFGGVPNEGTPAGFVGVVNVLIDAVLGGLGTLTAAAPLNATAVGGTEQLADPTTLQDEQDSFSLEGVRDAFANGYNGAPAGVTSAVYFSENTLLPPLLFAPNEGLDDAFFSGFPFDPEEPGPNGVVGAADFLISLVRGSVEELNATQNVSSAVELAVPKTEQKTGLFGASETRNPVAGAFNLPTPGGVIKNLVQPKEEKTPADSEGTGTKTKGTGTDDDGNGKDATGGGKGNGRGIVRKSLDFSNGIGGLPTRGDKSDSEADAGSHPVRDFIKRAVDGGKNGGDSDDANGGDTGGGSESGNSDEGGEGGGEI